MGKVGLLAHPMTSGIEQCSGPSFGDTPVSGSDDITMSDDDLVFSISFLIFNIQNILSFELNFGVWLLHVT
jgi:hypothetical protein